MRTNQLLPALALTATLALAACHPADTPQGCTLSGHIALPGYDLARLVDLDRQPLDSSALNQGAFTFTVADSVGTPYALVLQFVDREQPVQLLEMPLMAERGHVTMEIGEYVQTGGTPLNVALQQFLNELQACKDGLATQPGVTPQTIAQTLSAFYRQQILTNKDNALGRYLYHDYGLHLSPDDRAQVEAQLGRSGE